MDNSLKTTEIQQMTLNIVPLCTFLLLCLWVAFYYIKISKNKKGQKIPQGPYSPPFFGNSLQLMYHYYDRLEYLTQCFAKYGEVFQLTALGERVLAISNPDDVEYVLQTNFENFVKGDEFHSRLEEFLGDGIFNSDGTTWKVQRKTYSHMFSVRSLREHMTGVFQQHGEHYLNRIEQLEGTTFDIQKLNFEYTMDSIAEIAFGVKMQSLQGNLSPFATAFDNVNKVSEFRFINPIWKWMKWILPSEYTLRKGVLILDDFAKQIIDTRKQKSFNSTNTERQDMLSRFLMLTDENGQPYSDKYLRDAILSMVIAGRDTTAGLLTWSMYELCQHPEIQNEVACELKDRLHGEIPGYESVKVLEFMQAVLKETLRLHPQVPLEIKCAVQEDILPSGYHVNPKDNIMFLPWMMNRSSKMWDRPSEFLPKRWFEVNPTAFQFPTFLAGPRQCLGKNVAYLEATILLSMFLQKYKIELAPDQTIVYGTCLTLPVKNGLKIKIQPRYL